MLEIIKKVQKELNVNSCSIRVLNKLAEMSGLQVDWVGTPAKGPKATRAPKANIYGVKRKGSKGYRMTGTAKKCAEYMASEIEEN